MPVQRCPEEFRELFRLRYNEKFGDGLKLKPNKARIRATYRPASSSFGGQVEIPVPDLPDITQITGPSSKISDIVTACTDELEGYSRYLGRNPDGKNSIEATSYLPQPLLKKHAGKEFQKLTTWLNGLVSDVPVSVPFSSLLQQVPSINRDGFGKKEATAITNLLGKMSIGIEPDPRFGCFVPKPEQDIVIFRIGDNAPTSPSASILLRQWYCTWLLPLPALTGPLIRRRARHLEEEHLEAWLHLATDEKMRLRAHTQWLLLPSPA